MNKEIFNIRIKAWLCALAILILIGGIIFGVMFAPQIIKIIFNIVLLIVGIFSILCGLAIALNEVMS